MFTGVTEVFQIIFKVFSCSLKYCITFVLSMSLKHSRLHTYGTRSLHTSKRHDATSVNSLASLGGLSGSLIYQFCEGWRS